MFGEMSEQSTANLEKWSVIGLGLRGEMLRAAISVDLEEDVVRTTIQPSALFLSVR